MFGTFQAEEEVVDYGITTPVKSYNPIYLCFHEWIDILKDIKRSKSLREAYALTFARPSGLEEKKRYFRGKGNQPVEDRPARKKIRY